MALLLLHPECDRHDLPFEGTADLPSVSTRGGHSDCGSWPTGIRHAEFVKPGATVIDVGTTRVRGSDNDRAACLRPDPSDIMPSSAEGALVLGGRFIPAVESVAEHCPRSRWGRAAHHCYAAQEYSAGRRRATPWSWTTSRVVESFCGVIRWTDPGRDVVLRVRPDGRIGNGQSTVLDSVARRTACLDSTRTRLPHGCDRAGNRGEQPPSPARFGPGHPRCLRGP